MVHLITRARASSFIAASFLTVASSSRQLSLALAFAPPIASPRSTPSLLNTRKSSAVTPTNSGNRSNTMQLFYQAGTEHQEQVDDNEYDVISSAPQIDDTNHKAILNIDNNSSNPNPLPVLVDVYTAKCGPCKLIERSLQSILPKYTSHHNTILSFCKWNADTKETSPQFLSYLKEHNMIFRKLPTLLLFMDGKPVGIRSGMLSGGQIERFLEEFGIEGIDIDGNNGKNKGPRPKIGPDGALGISTRKMNR